MLTRASGRMKGLGSINFLLGSVDSLAFRNHSFDRVVCSGVTSQLVAMRALRDSLAEFNRILKPSGLLIVDFFNRSCPIILARRIILREDINPPEYISPRDFRVMLESTGFRIVKQFGFGFKQRGSMGGNNWHYLTDPCFVQERFSRMMESQASRWLPMLNQLGYRIYVMCKKSRDSA
jgi:ubiquinone/menaquinone biosynthesis C-methylase UbiE